MIKYKALHYCNKQLEGLQLDSSKIIKNTSLKLLDGHKSFSKDELCDHYPNTTAINQTLEKLKIALFPEYFSDLCATTPQDVWIQSLVSEIHWELTREIEAVAADSNISAKFIGHLPKLQQILYKDATAGFEGDPAASGVAEVILTYPGFYAVFVHRIANFFFVNNVPIIPRIMSEHAHSETGIDIHPGATIGEYFFIDHGTGVVIGETAVLGRHVKLYQGVTLGAISTRGGQRLAGKRRHPTVEDNVTIYAGATILGGDTVIGEGSTIGGNVFLTESVPSNSKIRESLH